MEKKLKRSEKRRWGPELPETAGPKESPQSSFGSRGGPSNFFFFPGQRVTALFQGCPPRYPGKVTSDNGDGTFAVAYDDGDFDPRVTSAFIWAL